MADRYLTAEAAGKELGIDASQVRRLCISGALPAQKHGRAWLIDPADLDKVRDRAKGGWPKGRPRKPECVPDDPGQGAGGGGRDD